VIRAPELAGPEVVDQLALLDVDRLGREHDVGVIPAGKCDRLEPPKSRTRAGRGT
jgi:hypothetical protein